MKQHTYICLAASVFFLSDSVLAQHSSDIPDKMTYPKTKKTDVVDTYFGTKVTDPYRWLEDDRAEDTKAWVKAENTITQNYLAKIPSRNAIKTRLEKLWNYEKFSAPFKEGEFTYFYKNDGLQNQYVLYRQKEGSEPEVFLDPNKFSKDATTSLAGIEFTKDGSMAAYQISEGGSDWRKVIILNTADKKLIGDTLTDIKFSGLSWKGKDGFYYSSYDKPAEGSQLSGLTQFHKLYYHKLGTSQKDDQIIFGGEKNPFRYIGGGVSEDNRYLIISAAESTTGNKLYIQDLSKPNGKIVNMVTNFEGDHNIIDNVGSKLYIHTNLNAPNYKVVTVDAANPEPANWKDLIPETENVLSVSTGGGKIFASYLKDATSMVVQYDLEGKAERTIQLPGVGSAGGFNAKQNEKELYFTFTSYIYPPTIFKYNVESGQSEVFKKSGVDFDTEKFESKQVFYNSKDGTRIPMIITYKKGLELTGKNPTLLYGYGGFNISLTPAFSTS
ncbi:MAG: S9 family peptidase, partial [Gloeobacteraceae cyanobacterium ES-bin-316]|nr:S9 family peptidase [Ferruginibacter sp.]